jgi:hypothetical protein
MITVNPGQVLPGAVWRGALDELVGDDPIPTTGTWIDVAATDGRTGRAYVMLADPVANALHLALAGFGGPAPTPRGPTQ